MYKKLFLVVSLFVVTTNALHISFTSPSSLLYEQYDVYQRNNNNNNNNHQKPLNLKMSSTTSEQQSNAFAQKLLGEENQSTTTSSSESVSAWSITTLSKYPNLQIRTKENVTLCDPDVRQIVGYLDVDHGSYTDHFFFWFFEARDPTRKTPPLTLWLNGGPGCSSITGLLMELGPCRVSNNGKSTKRNKYSWSNKSNVIFLDQPVNAGFSYSDNSNQVASSIDAAKDVYGFLQLFLHKYKEYQRSSFYVTGESYAGHYIPAIASVIVQNSGGFGKKHDKDYDDDGDCTDGENCTIPIYLRGIAIGNGLTDPLVQYDYYPEFACNNNYAPILSTSQCNEMTSKLGTCNSLISSCYKYENKFTCVPASIYCNNAEIGPVQKTGINLYDIRTKCQPDNPLCYQIIKDIETFMNLPEIQREIGVDREFKGCNMDVNMKFLMNGDWMKPYVRLVPEILNAGVNVLIYAGDADYICNWMGNKAWALELDWDGKDGFNSAKDSEWVSKLTGRPAGQLRSFGNLNFLRVYEAGHMVPYDQPEHSSEFFDAWIFNTLED